VQFRLGVQRVMLLAHDNKDEVQHETFASTEGIHFYDEKSLAVRLGIVPRPSRPRR
jgi:hypothetical protein